MPDENPNLPPQKPHQPDALELVCTGILWTEFGRRPTHAVRNAVIQLAAEDAIASPTAATPGWRERLREQLEDWRWRSGLAFGAATALLLGVAILYWKPAWLFQGNPAATVSICTLTDAQDTQWAANSPHLVVGGPVPAVPLRLESGVVELTFGSMAKVAVEGPAQFKLLNMNAMELRAGKIATDVPRRAAGFVIIAPAVTVTDLGTRFGMVVDSDRASEVDVFQGKVKVADIAGGENSGHSWRLVAGQAMMVDSHRAVAAAVLPESAFPAPGILEIVRPQNCGFDAPGHAVAGEVPMGFGYWSGPAYSLVTGVNQGIQPYNGPGMLQFLDPPPGHSADSEVWQLVDLRQFKGMLASGIVEADLSAYFNRVRGGAHEGNKFGLTLAAFRGSPANAPSLWARRDTTALALASQEIVTDDQAARWEKADVITKLPPETDFVVIGIRAIGRKDNNSRTPSFTGHFADLVDVTLSAPMRASSTALDR